METFVLNPRFSTTRKVTLIRPEPTLLHDRKLFLPMSSTRIAEGGLRVKGYFKDFSNSVNLPLVSIITVVFNNEKHLEQTILSVLNQAYDHVEYIIIDGGSTDKTIEIIRQYEDALDYWISEPDGGIYDAMNKGISCAFGDFIGILNSDDLFYDSTVVESIVGKFNEVGKVCVLYGDMIKFNDKNPDLYSYQRGNLTGTAFKNLNITINHPTCFVHRKLYHLYGTFNPKFKWGADRDLMMNFYARGVAFYKLDKVLAKFRLGGETTSPYSLQSLISIILQEYSLLSSKDFCDKKKIFIRLLFLLVRMSRNFLLYRILGTQLTNNLRILYLSNKFR